MAHYAFINDKNIVFQVIPGKDENELIDGVLPEIWYGQFANSKCLRTSYNANIRGNFAGIGFNYLPDRDIFMPPKCHEEASLDENEAKWNCVNVDHEIEKDAINS